MKRIFILAIMISLTFQGISQNERRFVRQGNRYYLQGVRDTTKLDTASFSMAENEYRRALEKKPDDMRWNFNLTNSQYKQMQLEEAANSYRNLAKQAETSVEKARALHNLGNSLLFQQKIDESIESYKEALRNNPTDLDTKYNLAYAQMLKNQQQNQDQQQQNQDQQQDQQQDQRQQPPPKISQQNAEQLLEALQNAERDIQDKVKKQQAREAKSTRVEKDW